MIIMLAGLTQLVAYDGDNDPSTPTDANKYCISNNWQTLPESALQPVDVFFIYPTTYFPNPDSIGSVYSAGWNQAIEQAHSNPAIQTEVASKSSVFYKAGTNLYVPYYQQAAGIGVLEALLWKTKQINSDAATTALEIAYEDVENAFDYYMANYNKDFNHNPGKLGTSINK